MKKVIPFTKTLSFKTMIAEVTDIEIKHDLKQTVNNEIEGNILVDGTYKMTDASQIEEEFHYKLPFTIEIDSKYNLDNSDIIISDFYFEIINEENLKINVEIEINGIEEVVIEELEPVRNKEETIVEDIKKIDDIDPLIKLESEIEKDFQDTNELIQDNNMTTNNVTSIFSTLTNNEETFSTYYVYIVRDTDTIESIIDKYKTTKEELQNYNDLTNVKVGSKLIIPCTNNE